jgi:hypothetical protein
MDYRSVFILDVLIGLIPAMIAYDKGHRFWKWWIFGAVLFIAAIPMAILLKPHRKAKEKNPVVAEGMKQCPYCAEIIKTEAVVCQFCGHDLLHSPSLVEPVTTGNGSPYFKIKNARMENVLMIAILVAIFLLISAMILLMLTNLNY